MNSKLKVLYLSFLIAHIFLIGGFLIVFVSLSVNSQEALTAYKNVDFYIYMYKHPLLRLLYVVVVFLFVLRPVLTLLKTLIRKNED
jgi:hypothetical protein